MKTRTLLLAGALLLTTATTATASAQRHRGSNVCPPQYGYGCTYPSYFRATYFFYYGSVAYRSGGASIVFGPGGGYYASYPTPVFGYGYSGPTPYYLAPSYGASGYRSYQLWR